MAGIKILRGEFKEKRDLFLAPQIKAGFPSLADDYQQESIDFNCDLIRHPESTFYGRVDGDHVLVTIITDGQKNSSVERTLKMVRNLIEKLKKQNWTFTLIGTDNLDVETMAQSFSINDHLTFKEDAEGTTNMFKKEQRSRMNYMFRLSKNIETIKGIF